MLIEQKILDLYIVAQNGDQEDVIILLRHNPDIINKLSRSGFSALHLATHKGHQGVFKLLDNNRSTETQEEPDIFSNFINAIKQNDLEQLKHIVQNDKKLTNSEIILFFLKNYYPV